MTQHPLLVLTCSRDAPHHLERLLRDLTHAVGRARSVADVELVVVDDSKSIDARRRCRGLAAGLELRTTYFGRPEYEQLLQRVAGLAGGLIDPLLPFVRPPGTGAWDCAGIRNVAIVHCLLTASTETVLLFVDDDIAFCSGEYAGHPVPASCGSVIDLAIDAVSNTDGPIAVGTEYWGRADWAALDHLRAACERAFALGVRCDGRRARFDSTPLTDVPTAVPVAVSAPEFGGIRSDIGLSGGFVGTNVGALAACPLPRCYNEDWIWLYGVRCSRGTLTSLPVRVTHDGELHANVELAFLRYQAVGEVLFRCVRAAASGEPAGTDFAEIVRGSAGHAGDEANRYLEQLSATIERLRAAERDAADPVVARDLERTIALVSELRRRCATDLSVERLSAGLRRYAASIPWWRDFAACLRRAAAPTPR